MNDELFQINVTYGSKNINCQVIKTKRKTMEIAVHPDSSVVVKAPHNADILVIEKKVYKRARWIIKQFNYFRQFNPKTPERQYINGETHLYLGKQYRLRISRGEQDGVKLTRGFFYVTCKESVCTENVQKLMRKWYLEKAGVQFNKSIDRCWLKFKSPDISRPLLSIRIMKKRWGSLSAKGTIILNIRLVEAPKECIDYVVTHELCHLKYNNHSTEFYTLLETAMPNWQKIKHKLELSLEI